MKLPVWTASLATWMLFSMMLTHLFSGDKYKAKSADLQNCANQVPISVMVTFVSDLLFLPTFLLTPGSFYSATLQLSSREARFLHSQLPPMPYYIWIIGGGGDLCVCLFFWFWVFFGGVGCFFLGKKCKLTSSARNERRLILVISVQEFLCSLSLSVVVVVVV